MELLKVGSKIPSFEVVNQSGEVVKSEDLKGKWNIVYFYPKDNTAGCSTEAIEFTAKKSEFEKLGVKIYGVSGDSVKKHQNFIEKKELEIELLSDEGHKMLEDFGVWQLKKMAGREYMGIVRSTFLVNPELEVVKLWTKVRVKGHVEAVFGEVKESLEK